MAFLRGIGSFVLGFVGAIAVGAISGVFAVHPQLDPMDRQPAQVREAHRTPDSLCERFQTRRAREACLENRN